MADIDTRAAERELLERFDADADGNMKFNHVLRTYAAAFYGEGRVCVRVDYARDPNHLRAIKAGTEKPDGINLSLPPEFAHFLLNQIETASGRLLARQAGEQAKN
jgi:hypothetical protein